MLLDLFYYKLNARHPLKFILLLYTIGSSIIIDIAMQRSLVEKCIRAHLYVDVCCNWQSMHPNLQTGTHAQLTFLDN